MPLSHQGRVRAPPREKGHAFQGAPAGAARDAAPGKDVKELQRQLAAALRDLRAVQEENTALREETGRQEQQKQRLETALEECMDLLLQVSNSPQRSTREADTSVGSVLDKERERLRDDYEAVITRERKAFSAEREHLRQQNDELRASYEDAVEDMRRCVAHEEELKRDRERLLFEMQEVKARLHLKEEEMVDTLVGSAKATTALADERKKREDEARTRRQLEDRLSVLSKRSDGTIQELAADTLRIRSQMHERRSQSGSDKWSLSPDNSPGAVPSPLRFGDSIPRTRDSTPSRVGVPSLPATPSDAGHLPKHPPISATPQGGTPAPYSALGSLGLRGSLAASGDLARRSSHTTPASSARHSNNASVDAI